MATSSNYQLGSIWLVTFDPAVGTEIRKTRPAVIISRTMFNRRRKVTLLPITSQSPDPKILPAVVPLAPTPDNGLSVDSYIVCIDPMTFDKQRLVRQLGMLEIYQIELVKSILRSYLELETIDRDESRF